jgi:hypothetical protein
MVGEIAIRTLGSADRWMEIFRLNPGLNPKETIPAGTRLLLPRDARMDPRDAP